MNEILAGREAPAGGLAALRRFAAPPSSTRSPGGDEAAERCELCGERLGPEHAHLVDLRQRSIGCACTACALLFDRQHLPDPASPVGQPEPADQPEPAGRPGLGGQPAPSGQPAPGVPSGPRYRTVPKRVVIDPGSPLTEAEWTQLAIPVAIAFFFVNSDLGRVVASYPSPAGVTECELDLAAWDQLADEHPLLREPEPDVEAILVISGGAPGPASDAADAARDTDQSRDTGEAPGTDQAHTPGQTNEADQARGGIDTFLVPIDACYSLAGALRMDWHGFDGGPEIRKVLADIMAGLRRRARPLPHPNNPAAPE